MNVRSARSSTPAAVPGPRAGAALPPLRLVEADRLAPRPWANGGGVTRELLRLPVASGREGDAGADAAAAEPAWQLRISLADIDADGPFSPFPGIERHFAVIAGAGVRLQFRHRVHALVPGDAPLAFDGGQAPDCRLVGGPTRDLNVMADRRRGRATLALLPMGEAWTTGADLARGLFAVDPVRLRRRAPGGAEGDSYSLPARTLAWCDGGDDSAWTLEGLGGASTGDARVPALPLALAITFRRDGAASPEPTPR